MSRTRQHIENQYQPRILPQMNHRQNPPLHPTHYNPNYNNPQYNPERRNVNPYDSLPQPPGSPNQYIIYYHPACDISKEVLKYLSQQSVYSQFTCIDISRPNTRIPKFLSGTPTAILPGMREKVEGDDIVKWVESNHKDKKEDELKKEDSFGGLQPYVSSEMGMDMAGYSYLDVKSEEQPMENSFVFLGREEQKIETPPEDSFGEKKKAVSMPTREMFPQGQQQQNIPRELSQPIAPQGTKEDKAMVNKRYEELMNRRMTEK